MPFWKKAASSSEVEFDPTFRYATSWILPPVVLFACRALLSLYAFVTIFFIFGWNGTHGRSWESEHSFSYFTNLTYWGLAFYYLFAAIHTSSYWKKGTPFLSQWPRFLQIAHGMFYSTVVVFPWIVTIVYWALLNEGSFETAFSSWSNISQHALNAAYALFEIIFPRTAPLPFLHMIPVIVILALYLGLAYLVEAVDDYWVYDFLDNKTNSPGKVAGYVVGILVAAVIVFLIIRYLIVFRVWITEKKLAKMGKVSRHSGAPPVEDAAEKGLSTHAVRAK